MNVIILRGISGSGKSTWAKKEYPRATVASADHYFLQADGSYVFDGAKLQEAHMACFQTFINALIRKDTVVIVDNTNVEVWEITPYSLAAQALGYAVELITFVCDPSVATARKQLVPPELVHQKSKRLELESSRFPPFLKRIHRIIHT